MGKNTAFLATFTALLTMATAPNAEDFNHLTTTRLEAGDHQNHNLPNVHIFSIEDNSLVEDNEWAIQGVNTGNSYNSTVDGWYEASGAIYGLNMWGASFTAGIMGNGSTNKPQSAVIAGINQYHGYDAFLGYKDEYGTRWSGYFKKGVKMKGDLSIDGTVDGVDVSNLNSRVTTLEDNGSGGGSNWLVGKTLEPYADHTMSIGYNDKYTSESFFATRGVFVNLGKHGVYSITVKPDQDADMPEGGYCMWRKCTDCNTPFQGKIVLEQGTTFTWEKTDLEDILIGADPAIYNNFTISVVRLTD